MLLSNSKDTIITNITQQGIGLIIFLIIPNLITVNNYAEITYAYVLISFAVLSDLGFASVYNRRMPSFYHSNNINDIERWNVSIFWLRFVTSILFSAIISFVFFIKSHNLSNSLMLLPFVSLTTISTFFISKYTVQSNFKVYRKLNSFQAYAKLLIIPLVYAFGIFGWFLSQSASALITLFKIREKIFPNKFYIDLKIIKQNLREGLSLVIVTFLWSQLLNSARLFASFYYPNEIIAQYGLISSGYQIMSSLIIAAFLPITIHVFKVIYTDETQAVNYVFKIIYQTIPVVFILAVLSSEITPYFLTTFFPKYKIDAVIVKTLIFSLLTYPLIVTLGNLMIAKQKTAQYGILTAFAMGLNWILVIYLEPYYGYQSAAIGQLLSISFYTFLELLFVFNLFGEVIKNKFRKLIVIYGTTLTFSFVYYISKKYLF